ncbi:MAG: DNA polymerase I, partial [Bacilli bacterium]|nr:DNA polymerase I [Bacilli bacterium]
PSNDIFVSIDYSQIELRLLAHIADAKELQQAFIDGIDIHTKVAADINGKDIKDVTKKERSYAKAVIFGIIYGISGFGLGENLHITPKEAKAFIDKYYELYPSVKNYMDDIIRKAHEDNVVRTMFNRKRTIEELKNKNFMIRQAGERIALNTPIQGTCADILKLAMVRIAKELEDKGIKSKMILQIHDELVFDCLNSEKDAVIKVAKDIMENVIKLNVPLRADASCGTDWYEAK